MCLTDEYVLNSEVRLTTGLYGSIICASMHYVNSL